RALDGSSHEVLDLCDALPGKFDAPSSIATGLDAPIRYDDTPCGPPTLTRHGPEERPTHQGHTHHHSNDAVGDSPHDDHDTGRTHAQARADLGPLIPAGRLECGGSQV